MRQAAVSYVENEQGHVLCVWNRRYGGWTFPGGKVEEGELIAKAQARELREETGLYTLKAEEIYKGLTSLEEAPEDRGRLVHVFRVEAGGIAQECERGCPVTYFTRAEFMRWTPFARFYREMFATLNWKAA